MKTRTLWLNGFLLLTLLLPGAGYPALAALPKAAEATLRAMLASSEDGIPNAVAILARESRARAAEANDVYPLWYPLLASRYLILDDGSPEVFYGYATDVSSYQFLWFNRFTPPTSSFPFALTEVHVYWDSSQSSPEDEISIYVWRDQDTDPFNGADLIAMLDNTVNVIDGFSVYPLEEPVVLCNPSDILIGVVDRSIESGITPVKFPAALDADTILTDRSWFVHYYPDDPGYPPVLSDVSDAVTMNGTWLVRGKGDPIDPNICDPNRYSISGYIRDHTGTPVPDAVVSSEPWGVAFTDDNGYYEIDALIGGVYVVTAMAGSRSLSPEARVVILPPFAEHQNFTTVPQYGQLSGVVREAGTLQPINNARVSVGGDVKFTNEQGEYILTEILPGRHTLRVSADDCEPYVNQEFSISENDVIAQDILLQSNISQDFYLPFPGGDSYKCVQGNHGSYSHFGTWKYAFDFDMENGDPVVATLEGRVVEIKEDSDTGCPEPRCYSLGNYVRIRHADGSDTLYYHLKHDSVTPEVDQFMRRGQQIARSDNTGYSDLAHLDITRHNWGGWDSIPLTFADVSGDGIPKKGVIYTSTNYPVATTTTKDLTIDDVPPRGNLDLILTGLPTHTLRLRAFGYLSDVTEVKLASSELGLEIADWSPYTTSLSWHHPAAYAQFRDANGNLSEIVSDTIDAVGYEAIDARFTISSTVCANAPLSITNQTTPFCEGCDWRWDFGNGVFSRDAEPEFDFSGRSSFYGYWSPGTYTVTLTVSNAFATTSFSRTVQTLPQPSADFTITQMDNTITVEAEELDTVSWFWRFGDGATATGRIVTHTYTGSISPDTYLVQLIVEGDQGCTNSSHQFVSIPSSVYLPLVMRN